MNVSSSMACFWASFVILFGFQNNFDKAKKTERSRLTEISINESHVIIVTAWASAIYDSEIIDVNISLCKKDNLKKVLWKTNIGKINYVPDSSAYLCLVYLNKESIFIYNCWNQKSFVIDINDGKILKKDESEYALLAYTNIIPIKLDIDAPSSGSKKFFPK